MLLSNLPTGKQWTSFQKASHDVDGLEITRTGSVPHTVRIQLLPAQAPERFSISPVLAGAIGEYLGPSTAFTKQDIVMATWEYIKRGNLIKEDDCRVVVCDYTLAEVLECVSLPFTSIIPALKPHLTPVRTVDLEYTLTLDGAKENEVLDEKFFDVDVSAVCEVTRARTRALRDWDELQQEQRKELALLKRQERDIVERLHRVALKHEWMRQFAADPCGFTSELAKSQDADQLVRGRLTHWELFWQPHADIWLVALPLVRPDPVGGGGGRRRAAAARAAVLAAVGP